MGSDPSDEDLTLQLGRALSEDQTDAIVAIGPMIQVCQPAQTNKAGLLAGTKAHLTHYLLGLKLEIKPEGICSVKNVEIR